MDLPVDLISPAQSAALGRADNTCSRPEAIACRSPHAASPMCPVSTAEKSCTAGLVAPCEAHAWYRLYACRTTELCSAITVAGASVSGFESMEVTAGVVVVLVAVVVAEGASRAK